MIQYLSRYGFVFLKAGFELTVVAYIVYAGGAISLYVAETFGIIIHNTYRKS